MHSDFDPKRGSGNFPSNINFGFNPVTYEITIGLRDNRAKDFRRMEAWGLAYVVYLLDEIKVKRVSSIKYYVGKKTMSPALESFRRRISYLQLINPKLHFAVILSGEALKLDQGKEMWRPESGAVITTLLKVRGAGVGKARRMEKELQDHIGSYPDNIGLSLLGDEFLNKRRRYGLLREVPTGVFHTSISRRNRILPTYFMDFLSFNKRGNIAVIELKVNDAKLEVICQLLDYALFATRYKKELIQLIKNNMGKGQFPPKVEKCGIDAYVVNNHYHPRFDKVAEYYSPKGHDVPF